MRVLVTGCAGFIGSHVVDALLARGDTVVGVDNFDPYYDVALKKKNVADIFANNKNANCNFMFYEADARGTLVDSDTDVIIHLAALAGVGQSIGRTADYINNNVMSTVNLMDQAVKHNVKNFVFASTSSVYGENDFRKFDEVMTPTSQPLAPYPVSKKTCELLGHAYYSAHGLNFTALRFFTVYGPRNRPDMMVYKLLESITKGSSVNLYNGGRGIYRDWTYVSDTVSGVLLATELRNGYDIINIGSDKPVELLEFIDVLERVSGGIITYEDVSPPKSDMHMTCASTRHALDVLGHKSVVGLEEGINSLWNWYKTKS